jgi:hypothetical protein
VDCACLLLLLDLWHCWLLALGAAVAVAAARTLLQELPGVLYGPRGATTCSRNTKAWHAADHMQGDTGVNHCGSFFSSVAHCVLHGSSSTGRCKPLVILTAPEQAQLVWPGAHLKASRHDVHSPCSRVGKGGHRHTAHSWHI